MPHTPVINQARLLSTFLSLLKIDSPSGQEQPVIGDLESRLTALGLITEIDATGNLIGRLAGHGEPLILCAHVDHVVPCIGINPKVTDGVIRSDGRTVLGGDDTSGVAIILELLELVKARRSDAWDQPALEIVLTVQEETGLTGSKGLDTSRLRAREAIVLDMGGPIGLICVQAPSQTKITAVVRGRKAHAGMAPELGINAIRVAAEAIASMPLGRIDYETTANIGVIHGGEATNIVPDRTEIKGEARSHDRDKLEQQTQAMVDALHDAANRHETCADVDVTLSYTGFRVPDDAPLVRRLSEASRACGHEPILMPTGGGSDANIFNALGIQSVAFSTGMAQVHTTEEQIAISDMALCGEVIAQLLGIQ
jgi:tripeptide aminopeptidase